MSKTTRKHLREISGPAWVWVNAAYARGYGTATIDPQHSAEINGVARVNAGLLNVGAVSDERHALALAELEQLAAACYVTGDEAGHSAVMLGYKALVDLFGPAMSPESPSGAHR